jgi:hypothetical protein
VPHFSESMDRSRIMLGSLRILSDSINFTCLAIIFKQTKNRIKYETGNVKNSYEQHFTWRNRGTEEENKKSIYRHAIADERNPDIIKAAVFESISNKCDKF